ncbi:MAG: hypothetical protein A2919_01260 [Candidatus Spechtbacteria bacterium RIFCSPLOWO2_01_FULL_43_12]|uniref:Transglycosylase SLT domain-containing protein n=1 Tax=Candidatus Spechtbacteria bacterium RIFCSPLOWO2_01_FULL_43_12 TaxID=1802162 RepID=A0A1G2HE86_9BACT|nr:MAG: hypothetical protein A2919_01260 [Candidatus Spechtbacteria bacterium RIFCSPLOWO2_01_FULL_43_12]
MKIFLINIYTMSKKTMQKTQWMRFSWSFLIIILAFATVFTQISPVAYLANAETTAEEKERLRQELEQLQKEFNQIEARLNEHKQESAGYKRDISILEAEISQIQLKIRRNELLLGETSSAIEINQGIIDHLEERARVQKELLSGIILGIYKLDDTSSLEIILTNGSLSEFFNDVNRIKSVEGELSDTLNTVRALKLDVEEEQTKLEGEVTKYGSIINSQAAQRAQLNQKTYQLEELLENSRTREYEQWVLAQDKQRSIQEVRNQLFRLEGAGIDLSFGQAYDEAKIAASVTGVRPALLLSVLKQESSWGKNVGLCKLYNRTTGEGIGVNTGTIYPRTLRATKRPGQALSDVEAFVQITTELGRDPYDTRVSCWPQIYLSDGTPYGYGGAMGPAQFIPTTWLMYKDRVTSLLGEPADPWILRHAFTASAIKLVSAGAGKQTYDAEWCAAMIYYSGQCPGYSGNWFYGDQVMARAAEYQKEIDILEGN